MKSRLRSRLVALVLLGAAVPGQAASRLRVTADRVDWDGIEFHALQVSAAPGVGATLDVTFLAAGLRGVPFPLRPSPSMTDITSHTEISSGARAKR